LSSKPVATASIGHVVIKIEPLLQEDGHYARNNQFVNAIVGGTVPKEYIPAVESGVMAGLASGSLAGYPVVGVQVTLLDGSYHTVDSSEIAFEQAGILAIREALSKAGPVLLEPIMRVQVVVPEHFGAVQGNLIAKRGVITDSKTHGMMRVIDAKVPLSEMFGYSSQIRGATQDGAAIRWSRCATKKCPNKFLKKFCKTVDTFSFLC
jgi:elongation factor G